MPWWCRTCREQVDDPEQHTLSTGHAAFDNALVDRHATLLVAGELEQAAAITAELEARS
jgi:hypothetical protein